MKIEVEEKEILDMIVKRFANSASFKETLSSFIREEIRRFSNDFFDIGYSKGYKKSLEDLKDE